MGPESSGHAVQIAIVVTRVTAEFEAPLRRQRMEKLAQSGCVKMAGRRDPNSPIRSEHPRIPNLKLAFEFGLEIAEQLNLKAAKAIAVAQSEAPGSLERIANRPDGTALGYTQERSRNSREEVRVFVRVQMSNVNAGALQLLDLCKRLPFNLVFADLATDEHLHKGAQRRAKGFAIGTHQSRNTLR